MDSSLRNYPDNPPRERTPERIVISGTGTVIPQGCTTYGAALSLRLRKSAWCEHEQVLVAADPHGIVLRGATVSRLPEEFAPPELDGAERAAALLSPALSACLTGLSPAEIRTLDCRIDTFLAEGGEDFYRLLRETFPALFATPGRVQAEPAGVLGRCAFYERVMQAAEELRAGQAERLLVGCVDSLCATSWLRSVRGEGVLKDCINPEGIIAGEAAGAVLLELESAARKRTAPVLAVLSSWGRGTERDDWYGESPATGRGLAEAFHQALSPLDDGGKNVATVIADLNGERHRALDWAYAEGKIFPDGEREPELRHPAFITGDCGGAMGAVMLADALGRCTFHAGFRGRIALATSDEEGARRVICLEPGDVSERGRLMPRIRAEIREQESLGQGGE